MLQLQSLFFDYEGIYVLSGLELEVPQGEIVAIIGLSGSGKTTLFRLICGLLSPQKGNILIDSQKIDPHQIAYLMQEDLLLPWRTVEENLWLIYEINDSKSMDKKLFQEELITLLQEMRLDNYRHFYPHELSGGMRQRVALARCFLQKRPLLLLDEPFGSLDTCTRSQIYQIIRKKHRTMHQTILIITHDISDALILADRIVLLSEGKIAHEWKKENANFELNTILKEFDQKTMQTIG